MTKATAAAKQQFEASGLRFPFVPEELENALIERGDWLYATRDDTPTPYDLSWFVDEVGTAPVGDYALLGVNGHGVGSRALHYYLVRGPLALFLQLAWPAGREAEAARLAAIDATLARVQPLVAALDEAQASGQLAAGERIILQRSDFYDDCWKQLSKPGTLEELYRDEDWHESDDIFDEVESLFIVG